MESTVRRWKIFCTYAQLHTQRVLPKALYPNFNPTEIPLPKPNPGEMYLSSKP